MSNDLGSGKRVNMDRWRMIVQGAIAVGVLGGTTYLGVYGVISSEAVVALFSGALGAVGAGAVGGSRPANGER